MIERGSVEKIEGDTVMVKLDEQAGCAACVNTTCKESRNLLSAWNDRGVELAEGDSVEVNIDGAAQAVVAFWVLGLPVATLFAGYYAASSLFGKALGDWPGILGGVLGLAIGLVVGVLVQKRRQKAALPKIVGKTRSMEGAGEAAGPEGV